jgi:hypothetical protein
LSLYQALLEFGPNFDLEFGFLSQKTVRKPQPRSLDPGTEVEKTVGFLAEKIVMFGEDKMAVGLLRVIKGHFCLQIPAYFTLQRLVSFGNYNSIDRGNDCVSKEKNTCSYCDVLFVVNL